MSMKEYEQRYFYIFKMTDKTIFIFTIIYDEIKMCKTRSSNGHHLKSIVIAHNRMNLK